MNRIRRIYIPSLAIVFTLVMVWSSLYSLILSGFENGGYSLFVLEIFGCIFVSEAVDMLLAKVEFKTYARYFAAEAVILYAVMFGFAYVCGWFPFRVTTIVLNSAAFFGIMWYVHYHFYQIGKAEADEINRLLDEKR